MKQGRLWNYLSTVGKSFERFTFKLTNCVEEGMPEADPDRSPSFSLDEFKVVCTSKKRKNCDFLSKTFSIVFQIFDTFYLFQEGFLS